MSNKKTKAIVEKVDFIPQSAESLISQAISKGVSVETMERLMAMRRELKAEKSKESYDMAMAGFQMECPIIKKTKSVKNKDGTKRYSFAPLDSIIQQVKPLLQKYGFSYSIDTQVDEKWVAAICKVTNRFGHSETSTFKVTIDSEAYMTAPQKFASALTFAKRYAFCDAFGILTSDEDTDANEESKKPGVQKPNEPETETNHILKLKAQLVKMGAKTDVEAFKIIKEKTGLIWKDFGITQKQAQIALFMLLNESKK